MTKNDWCSYYHLSMLHMHIHTYVHVYIATWRIYRWLNINACSICMWYVCAYTYACTYVCICTYDKYSIELQYLSLSWYCFLISSWPRYRDIDECKYFHTWKYKFYCLGIYTSNVSMYVILTVWHNIKVPWYCPTVTVWWLYIHVQ